MAESTWRRAFELEPTDEDTLAALERSCRKRDDWETLRETFETALAASDRDVKGSVAARFGTLLLDRFDDPTRARSLFETALAGNPACRSALVGLRRIAEDSGDPELLLETCEREVECTHDPDAIGDLARIAIPILRDRQRNEEALDWATRWTSAVPEALAALTARAEFEALLDRVEDEIETRRKLAKRTSGADRSQNLQRLAELYFARGDDDRACEALEQALRAEPDARETLTALCEAYRRLERAEDLARTLRRICEGSTDEVRSEALEELASLLQDPIGDIDAAIVIRWQLAELPDAPAEAQDRLETLLESAGRYAELAQLLQTRRRGLEDGSDEAFALDLRRGEILLDSLGQSEDAAEIFSALHELDPENERILDLLERALRVGENARGLVDLLERRAQTTSDPERGLEIQIERASLLEERLADPIGACDLYDAIVASAPDSPTAAMAGLRLESLLESSGQWERLRDWLVGRLDGRPAEEEATLRERIAAICRERLHDVPACAEQLEAIAEIVPDRVHVWQQLAEIYAYELDRPGDWLRVVESELATNPPPEREFTLRVGAARLCLDPDRRPGDRDESDAIEHYERVLAIHPTHAEAAEVLALHHSTAGHPEDTLRVLETRLDHLDPEDESEAIELRLRIARLLAGELGRDECAQPLFESVLADRGAVSEVADPLAELYERTGAWEELSALCRQAIDLQDDRPSDPTWRIRLGISEKRCGRPESAAAAYRAALEQSPDDREIEAALIDLYEEIGEADPLANLLEKRLVYAREDEAIDLRLRLARLHDESRNEPEQALSHLEGILELHPQHHDAFEHALDLAERIGDPDRTLALLDRALEVALPSAERASLLERRGRILADELGRAEEAVANLREAVSLDRDNASARRSLRRELEQLHRWPAVLDCLFVEASGADPERRTALLEEASQIAWTHLGPDAALPWLARLREARPDDPTPLARMAEAHGRAGRFEAALRALEEELTLRSDPALLCDLHVQRAHILERELHSPSRAVLAYQSALALASDGTAILEELDRLYAEMGRPFERAEILEARIAGLDASRAIELRRTLASLYCSDLAKPELALPHLEANVEATRGDEREELVHLGALDTALRASARREAWVATAERELELIENHPELAESTPVDYVRFLREELARTWDEDLGNPDRAIVQLRILCGGDSPAPRMRQALRRLLRRTGRLAELARHLTEELATDEDATAVEWLELARLREERLLDPRGALEAYRRAETDRETRLDALRGRRRCAERLRDWDGVALALEAEAEETSNLDRIQRAAIARTLGETCLRHFGASERTVAAFTRALEINEGDLCALRSLQDVRAARGEHAETIALLRRELALLEDDPEGRHRRFEAWSKIAVLSHTECDAPDDAIRAYREAASIERLSAEDELCLARLHESAGDFDEFASTFARWCDREDSNSEVRDHLELARRLMAHDRRDAARARAERATALAPENPEAWALLGDLERAGGENEKASEAFARAADHADAATAAGHLVQAAVTLGDANPDRVAELLERAIRLDPAHLEARIESTRISSTLERPEATEVQAEAVFELGHAASLDEAIRLEIALLGGRAARELGHRDACRRFFEIAREVDPDHVEATLEIARAHFADGEFRSARPLLERRLEQTGTNGAEAEQRTMLARCLEAEDLLDAAWSQYEEAIVLDPSIDDAHDGLVRVHERAGRPEEAMKALEHWSQNCEDPERRALAAFRAAEHAIATGDPVRARRNLELATRSDPHLAPAWALLCQLVGEQGNEQASRRLCSEALEAIEPGPDAARISLRAARLAEIAGEHESAIERYADAARWDPRCTDAVLCESRLIRMAGDWREADSVLARFIEAHPDPDSPTLAQVHLERGRLLAGPLEECDRAIDAYERALELQSDLGVARTALAGLLLHAPERWREALRLHREILSASPTTPGSLRALVRLAEQRNQPDIASDALALLHALGQASRFEAEEAPDTLRIPIQPGPPMGDPEAERLRRLAHQLSDELSGILEGLEGTVPECPDAETAEAIERILRIEDELSAPYLNRLDADERASLFFEIAALFLDPGGNGGDSRYRDALDRSLGRWTRRKVRRIVEETDLHAIGHFDHVAWGDELRAIAAAQAIDRSGGRLRPVLLALLVLDDDGAESRSNPEGAEIGTLASTSETACRLLGKITTILCDRLERSH